MYPLKSVSISDGCPSIRVPLYAHNSVVALDNSKTFVHQRASIVSNVLIYNSLQERSFAWVSHLTKDY